MAKDNVTVSRRAPALPDERDRDQLHRVDDESLLVHPGEIIWEEFMVPKKMSQADLARAARVPPQTIHEIVNGKRSLTPATARKLAEAFDVTPVFLMNLQMHYDLQKERLSLTQNQTKKDETNDVDRLIIPVGHLANKVRL